MSAYRWNPYSTHTVKIMVQGSERNDIMKIETKAFKMFCALTTLGFARNDARLIIVNYNGTLDRIIAFIKKMSISEHNKKPAIATIKNIHFDSRFRVISNPPPSLRKYFTCQTR
jgi:hypothetical protein